MHSKDAGRVLITTRTTAHRHHRRLAKLNNTRKARQVIAEARDLLGGNGILLENHIIRHMGDFEVIHQRRNRSHANPHRRPRHTGIGASA